MTKEWKKGRKKKIVYLFDSILYVQKVTPLLKQEKKEWKIITRPATTKKKKKPDTFVGSVLSFCNFLVLNLTVSLLFLFMFSETKIGLLLSESVKKMNKDHKWASKGLGLVPSLSKNFNLMSHLTFKFTIYVIFLLSNYYVILFLFFFLPSP